MEGGGRVVGSDRQRDPAGTAADTKVSATILAAGKKVTAHVQTAEHTGVAVEPLPRGCIVEEVEGGGEEDPAWVGFFMGYAVSVDVQWEADEGRCLVLSLALASNHH